MHLEARRFFSFLLFATVLSVLGYITIFTPPKLPTLEHLSLPKWTQTQHAKYTYATFLGPPTSTSSSGNATTNATALPEDPYFTTVRLLNYQIRHAPKTRTKLKDTPFLVLTLPSVPQSHIDVLKKEGATIVQTEPLNLPDAFNKNFINNSRFRDVLAKLRLWELVSWDKIIYLDADSYLLQNLDDLFTEPSLSHMQKTLAPNASAEDDGVEPPKEYLMAASTDTYGDQTPWEEPGHVNYLCACFMLFAPSAQLFDYYYNILTLPNPPPALRDAYYPEQDLLIYVHRLTGRMPWRRIPITWSANDGEMNDEYALKGGIKSLHVKGWQGAEGGNVANEKYKEVWRGLVKEMEEYWSKA